MDWLWLLPVLFPAVGFFWGNCPCCATCGGCNISTVTITIEGLAEPASGSGACTGSCASWNGTWVLDESHKTENSNEGQCEWLLNPGICGSSPLDGITVHVTRSGGNTLWTVILSATSGLTQSIIWQKSFVAPKCSGDEVLPHLTGGGFGFGCDPSGATVTMEAA